MDAAFILRALRAHHHQAAIVSEVLMGDEEWLDQYSQGLSNKSSRRIDGLMFRTLERTAIEIKVSKADFLQDDWNKRRPWMRVTHRFVYAVPAGLVDAPHYGCGLWWVHEDGQVEVRTRAKRNPTPEPLPQQVVQALAYRAMNRERQ